MTCQRLSTPARCTLLAALCCAAARASGLHHRHSVQPHSHHQPSENTPPDVFVGVLSGGVAFRDRRNVARTTWMTWAPSLGMSVAFFVDVPASPADQQSMLDEMMQQQDIVFMDTPATDNTVPPTDPGSPWNRKAAWILQHGLSRGNFTFLVRTDDDSFWCLHRLRHVLAAAPHTKFFMAHYYDNHTDVQFVASRDVALDFVAHSRFGTHAFTWTASNFSWSPGVEVCNAPSMTLGKHPTKGNLRHEGWLAPEELPVDERATFCERYIANHQSYPARMQATYDAVKQWASRPLPDIYASMQPVACRADLLDGSETVL